MWPRTTVNVESSIDEIQASTLNGKGCPRFQRRNEYGSTPEKLSRDRVGQGNAPSNQLMYFPNEKPRSMKYC